MNFARFDLNLLRVFDAMLHERSTTRAGERLGLSQPAVSAALNRLRHLLDDQLFVRRGAQMIPTPRAEALEAPITEALTLLERSLAGDARFDAAASERTFTLLASDFFALVLFPALAARLAEEAPRVRLRALDIPRDGIERPLLEGQADLALERPARSSEWMAQQPLFDSPFVIIAARDHPDLADTPPGSTLPLDLFCRLPHVLRTIEGDVHGAVDDALAAIGRKRLVSLAVSQFQGVLLAVAQSRMIAALPLQMAEIFAEGAGVSVYASPIELGVPTIHMLWHRRQSGNPAHRWLRQVIVETLAARGFAPGGLLSPAAIATG